MTLYVVGPVSGKPDNNRLAFEGCRKRLMDAGHDVKIPHDLIPPYAKWHHAVAESVRMIDRWEGIAVMPGSDRSVGAQVEIMAAKRMGIPVMSVQGWANRRRR